MKETCKKFTGFDGYLISDTGKIKSIDRAIVTKAGPTQTFRGRYLVLRNNNKCPHLFFEVSKVVDDKPIRKTFYIHKEVANHFLPAPNKNQIYVTHIDDNCNNNHVENLKWITHKELMSRQPNRIKEPNKSWETRRKLYGKSGSSKTKNLITQ